MSIRAVKGITPEWYVPASEHDPVDEHGHIIPMVEGPDGEDQPEREPAEWRKKENAAEFKLRPLTQIQVHEVLPELSGERATRRGVEIALGYGLVEWRNVEGEDGPLECSLANALYLPWQLQQELASEIVVRAMPSEDDRKKS